MAALAAIQPASSPEEQLRGLKFIKNSVIGNRTKKLFYVSMGIIPILGQILGDPNCNELIKIEAAVVLGSLAHGGDNHVIAILESGVVPLLLNTISSSNQNLVEASARALKSLFQRGHAPAFEIFQPSFLHNLIALLSPDLSSIAAHLPTSLISTSLTSTLTPQQQQKPSLSLRLSEIAASIVAKISTTLDNQKRLVEAGAVPLLVSLLNPQFTPLYSKLQESALDALSSLCRDNGVAAELVANAVVGGRESAVSVILGLVKDINPVVRLLATSCLTNMYRVSALPSELRNIPKTILLPTLIKLISTTQPGCETGIFILERAPLVFADLVLDRDDLQTAAMEGDAIAKIAAILVKDEVVCGSLTNGAIDEGKGKNVAANAAGSANGKDASKGKMDSSNGDVMMDVDDLAALSPNLDRVKESAFIAIAAVCSLKEECRKQAIEANILPSIVRAMQSQNSHIRAAACKCTRSLSRSVKTLRTALVDAGVANPLFTLLDDPNLNVRITASATLCNIVLDFSPMKRAVLEGGGIERIVRLVGEGDANLRLNAVWALKNLLFQAESGIKERVLGCLGWDCLQSLLNDLELPVQEQAMNLLRNLACGSEADIQAAFTGMGAVSLMSVLRRKIDLYGGSSPVPMVKEMEDIVLQTLYVVVNISTGNESHKSAIMADLGLLEGIGRCMSHPSSLIRLATVWCLINLTEADEPGCRERIEHLKSLGFQERLKGLTDDPDGDVRDRVKTALANMGVTVDTSSSYERYISETMMGASDTNMGDASSFSGSSSGSLRNRGF
ncbi:Armadillo repeat-containing protein 8 [Blyttiomyces sp. JEL0837]|nr:Armadillo repeat-containing protein 8 [Blyttiomyces sp. JEL0837]